MSECVLLSSSLSGCRCVCVFRQEARVADTVCVCAAVVDRGFRREEEIRPAIAVSVSVHVYPECL